MSNERTQAIVGWEDEPKAILKSKVVCSRVTSLTIRDYGANFRKRQFPPSLEY